MDRITTGEDIGETEHLTSKEHYHDYLITSLRTKWGADPAHIEEVSGPEFRMHFEKQAQAFIEKGSMSVMAGRLVIEPGQWLITDHILRALFMD